LDKLILKEAELIEKTESLLNKDIQRMEREKANMNIRENFYPEQSNYSPNNTSICFPWFKYFLIAIIIVFIISAVL
jgi:hypothetical protein